MLKGILKGILPILCLMLLGACAVPGQVQLASWALDGVSLLTTQKSLSDHGLSILAQKDCAVWRGLKGEDFCVEGDPIIMLAYSKDAGESVAQLNTGVFTVGGESLLAEAEDTEIAQLASFETASGPPDESPDEIVEMEFDDADEAELSAVASLKAASGIRHELVKTVSDNDQPAEDIEEFNLEVLEPSSGADGERLVATYHPPENHGEFILAALASPGVRKGKGALASLALPQRPEAVVGQGKPAKSLYYVIGSFKNSANAERMAARYARLETKVMQRNGRRQGKGDIYRSVVGPFAPNQRKDIHRRIARAGIGDAWPTRIDSRRWSILPPAELAMGGLDPPDHTYGFN